MAKKDDQAAPDQAAATPAAEAATAQYQYVGDVISNQVIGGQAVLLAPGAIVSVPSGDPVTARLLAQKLLVPYTLRQERHG
jgi:hypothetical protein